MERQIWVNLPVRDLERSRRFFEALGFAIEPHFTGPESVAVVLGERMYAMLLSERFFATFTPNPVCDAHAATEVLVCLSCADRAEVDGLVARAVAAGGSVPREPHEHPFMYGHAFADPDGHIWELVAMRPAEG